MQHIHIVINCTCMTYLFPFSRAKTGKRSRNRSSEWCRTGIPLRVRYCLGMLAFILEPVPPARRTKPTSDRSVSAVGKDSSLPPADASDVEEVVVAALCFNNSVVDAEIDDGRAATPSDCVNAYDVGVAARAAAAASVVDAQIFILKCCTFILCMCMSKDVTYVA